VVIGWTGTASNLEALEQIQESLMAVMKARPRARLLVVADAKPRLSGLPADRVDFKQWSVENEADTIRAMDIGIMPLPDTEWSRGKCSYKMLLYMACGLPVVVSPFGMNADVLRMGNVGYGASSREEWVEALIALIDSEAERRGLGLAARDVVINRFSVDRVVGMIEDGLRRAAGG